MKFSDFGADGPVLAAEGSSRDIEVFGGHFQVVESAVGPGLAEIGFCAGVLLDKLSKIPLPVL